MNKYKDVPTDHTKTVNGVTFRQVQQIERSWYDKTIFVDILDAAGLSDVFSPFTHATLMYNETGYVWHSKTEDDTNFRRSVPTITFVGYGKWVKDDQ